MTMTITPSVRQGTALSRRTGEHACDPCRCLIADPLALVRARSRLEVEEGE